MIHPLDRLGGRLLARSPNVFPDGWGDAAVAARLDLRHHPLPPVVAADLQETRRWEAGGLVITDAVFPGSPELNSTLGPAHLRVVSTERVRRWCVVMPAWNDEGYRSRTPLAMGLVRRGIGAVLLEIPFYGRRRTHPRGPAIRSVAEFALMGRAAVTEALAVLATLRPRGPVGVTGYSMGGNLAAFVGALCPHPLAIAPLAASPSPGPVYLEGILRRGIAWDAFDEADASRLASVLGAASVLDLPPTPATARAVLVAALRDGFVPPRTTVELHRHWPGSELRWCRAGHGTLWWLRRRTLVAAIEDAFTRCSH